MSDFDREAERERLREKYENDEQKREHSERMSELLLKGATMTNVHCEECGDPVFRYDGQEFCPTCQREVGAGAGAEAGVGDDAPGTADSGAAEPTEPASGDGRPDAGGAGADAGQTGQPEPGAGRAPDLRSDAATGSGLAGTGREAEPSATPEASPDDRSAGRGPVPEEDATPGPAVDAHGAGPEGGQERAGPDPSAPTEPRPEPTADDGTLSEARAALVRTLTDAARRAEATSDPRTRRDHLAAAREAAEALSALR